MAAAGPLLSWWLRRAARTKAAQLFIFELDHGADRLAGENMFGQHETQFDAREVMEERMRTSTR